MRDWADKIRGGDVRALARAISAVENRRPEAVPLLREVLPFTGRARVIGVTGAPGVGKSTLVDGLIRGFRAQDRTVGVLAIDPSSPLTGGAVLGDRVRMEKHHADPGVFIRSMASRGAPGGLAAAAGEAALLLDAAGKDIVLIETLGVGQDETGVAGLAGVTLLVLAPGFGDQVQALKAGVMEIASLFVVNKADMPGSAALEAEIREMVEMAGGASASRPRVLRAVATTGEGIEELLAAIDALDAPAGIRVPPPLAGAETFAVDHLGIAVRSIDEALRFYRDKLGMTVATRENIPEERVTVVMLPAGQTSLELLEATAPDSVIARFIDRRGEGLHHVALRVSNLDAAVARLQAAGARLINPPREGAGGRKYVFIHPASTGGVLLELVQDQES